MSDGDTRRPKRQRIDQASADARFMAGALALGRRGLGNTWPNPAVGCLVVRDDGEGPYVVGRGFTRPGGRPHAETEALAEAGELARGATAYVTLEPCSHHGRTPPCANALVAAGVARVVGALRDPDPRVGGRGFAVLAEAGVAVTEGVCAHEAQAAHLGHLARVELGRPAVMLKLAMSCDGFIAGPGGAPVRITGEDANARVHMMRAQADAIAVGIGTALADDPLLTVRLPGMAKTSPVRIVFDAGLKLPPTSKLVASAAKVPLWLIAAPDAPPARHMALVGAGVEVIVGERTKAGVLDLALALRLISRRGISRLMVEGGARIAAALIGEDLVDEAVLFTAPDPISDGIPGLLPHARAMLEAQLPSLETEQVGRDMMTSFSRA